MRNSASKDTALAAFIARKTEIDAAIERIRSAIAYTLIETAKLYGVDPQAWLADTLARIPDWKITRVDELLPWNAAK